MRILFVDQQPRTEKSVQPYDIAQIEALLNSYASPGTKVEIVFPDDYEGAQLFDSIGARDYPVVEAMLLLVTMAVIAANWLADLLYGRLDPRIQRA